MNLTPSSEQRAILDLGPTTIRVRAGAGTGKTTTVAMVIANLVENHSIAPESILGLTFTNKAAAELATRVRELLPDTVDASRQVEVHTYHGFAAQLLSEFGPIAGVDVSRGVITPTFGRQLIRDVVMHGQHRLLDITNIHVTDKVRRLADQMGDHLLTPEEVTRASEIHDGDETWATRVEIAETLARYNTVKAELRVVDYADLVTTSARVLGANPELAALVRSRYQVLVLDEYQDTNPAQRVLLTTIFAGGFPVIAVGDEDQTIYEWRGASAENFELFVDHFRRADGSPAHDKGLTSNRRSGHQILEVANDVRRKANPTADLLVAADETEAEVLTYWAPDALAEAEWIASRFEDLREQGVAWRDMAVLFRKNKDFAIVVNVLSRHDIPLEVANVGGLLSVPEIGLLRAWLTILDNPDDSAAVAQILFGSSYRLGIADMAALTRWVADLNQDFDTEVPHSISLIEALEDDSVLDLLRPEARTGVVHFRDRYRALLVETQSRSLAESCRLVLDHINAWNDIEAMAPNARLSARLNIYRFLDLADDWSPLTGRPSLSAFLDYLVAMEDEPADELDSARLSGEDAVTLVTVHRAKGLEWENVAIPAVAHENFPARSGAFPDPLRFAEQLPIELRLDDVLTELPEDRKARDAFLRERHLIQEWRVAYVAVTRAKRRLFVSGAHWYGLPQPKKNASKPSEFFDIVENHPASRSDGHSQEGPRPEILRPPDSSVAPDPLFVDGWHSGLRMAVNEPEEVGELADQLGISNEHQNLVEAWTDTLFRLDDAPQGVSEPEERTISVTGLVTYAQCPKRYYWTEVDTLPRKPNPAAVRGNQIHRRIELHQRGQVPFEDLEPDLYDAVGPAEGDGVGGYAAYEESRFAEEQAALVEAPFTIDLSNNFRLRGRIDAVYAEADRWEVVDFKSGRSQDDPSRIVQLQAYALAVQEVDFGLPKPSEIKVTFAYLGGGVEEVTHEADDDWVAEARATVEKLTEAIGDEVFPEAPGLWCGNCDFLRFCEPGQREVRR